MNGLFAKFTSRIDELRADYGRIGFWAVYALLMPIIGLALLSAVIIQTGPWFKSDPIGPYVFLVLVGIFCGTAVLTTNVISVVAGWAIGFWIGFFVMWAGILLAISINYVFSQLLAAKKFKQILESKPRIKAIHEALLSGNEAKVYTILMLLRLSVTPFAGTNYLISVSGVSFFTYIWTTMIGYIPRTAMAVFVGTTIDKLTGDVPTDPRVLFLSLAATIAVFAIITGISKRALSKMLKAESAEAPA